MEVINTSQPAIQLATANFSGVAPAAVPPSSRYSNRSTKQFAQSDQAKNAVREISAQEHYTAKQDTEISNTKRESTLTEVQAGEMTEEMNKFMERLNTDIHFTLHEKTERLMLQVVDRKNGEIIKEIPSEEMLDMLAKISEYVGVLLDKKA